MHGSFVESSILSDRVPPSPTSHFDWACKWSFGLLLQTAEQRSREGGPAGSCVLGAETALRAANETI